MCAARPSRPPPWARLGGMAERRTHKDHYVSEWRAFLGWTQEDLAEKAGVTHGTISRLENDKIELTAKLLRKLSKAMDVRRGALLDPAQKKLCAACTFPLDEICAWRAHWSHERRITRPAGDPLS